MAQSAKKMQTAPSRPVGAGRRGRPAPDRITAIDTAIREAALAVFLDLGFESASMDAIALKAGVSKGTLYARYGSKEPLFRAILELELERWSQRAGEQDHLLPDALAPRLHQHARKLLEVFGWPEYKRITRLLTAAAPTLPDIAQHWENIGTKRFLRFLTNDMAKVAGQADVNWDFYAQMFLFSVLGLHRAQIASGCANDQEMLSFADQIISLISLATTEAGIIGQNPE